MFAFRRTAWTHENVAAWAARHDEDERGAGHVDAGPYAPMPLHDNANMNLNPRVPWAPSFRGNLAMNRTMNMPVLPPIAAAGNGVGGVPLPRPLPVPTSASSVLSTLQMQQQLMSRLLQVHPLSAAIEYDANRPLHVNAVNWWRELCHQSATGVIRRESRKRRLSSEEAMDLRWWEPTNAHLPPHSSPSVRAMQMLIASQKKVFLREVFQRLLRTLSGTTTRLQHADQMNEPTRQVVQGVDDAIGAVGAQLLRQWRDETPKTEVVPSRFRRDSDAPQFAQEIVGFLIQFYEALGTFHPLHEHKLLPCAASRAFTDKESWECAMCQQEWSTNQDDGSPFLVFRCHACDFSLCEECISCMPPNNTDLQGIRRQQEAFQQHLNVERFFALVLPQLHETLEDFRTIAPAIAVALRTRLRDLPVYSLKEMVPMATLLVNMLESSRFPRAMIDYPDFRWLPLYISGGRVRVQSFLAPLLWWSTLSDESKEAEIDSDGDPRAPEETVRLNWNGGYHLLKKLPTRMLKALLNHEQDPYVVDATLCWIATCITTMMTRRNGATGVSDNADGLLINLSLALVEAILPTLGNQPHMFNTDYHEGLLPRRAFPEKEMPLRSHRKAHESERISQEDERIRMHDLDFLRNPNRRDDVHHHYYPHADRHYGVQCNSCGAEDMTSIRYKCAFCEEIDICSDCFDNFCVESSQHLPRSRSRLETSHPVEHVFIRVDVPVPLISVRHFVPIGFDESRFTSGDADQKFDLSQLRCAGCRLSLQFADVLFKCSNCHDHRLMCRACVEQEERFHDPNRMHVPGHLYFALPRKWCETYNLFATDLQFRSLFYPAPLLPRERFNTETELLYMAIKCIHIGPLHTLAQYIAERREANEMRAFCTCDEDRVETERRQRERVGGVESLIRMPHFSSHYAVTKTRVDELDAKKVLADMHLIDPANVMLWVRFYSKACSWLLRLASPSQNPFEELVQDFSSTFSSFPEHFFVDACDMTYLLSLDCVDYQAAKDELHDDEADVIEPLLVMFVQLLASPHCTKNPHLRVHAAKALSAVIAFFSNCRGNAAIRAVFDRCTLLRLSTVRAVLQFHEQMETYHKSNSGPPFTTDVGNGDQTLWGFLSIRMTTSLLIRYLWQIPSQRSQIVHAFHGVIEVGNEVVPTNQSRMLLVGLWNDAAKLVDEAASLVVVLRQLAEQQDAMWHGHAVSLPFRPAMMDEYVSQHSKQLRLTFRMICEIVDTLSWVADQPTLRRVLLKPEMVDQAAHTTCLILFTISTAVDTGSWSFSIHLQQDGRTLLAHLMVLLTRCSGRADHSSLSSVWRLMSTEAETLKTRLGDLDTHARESLISAIVRLEANHFSQPISDSPNATEDVSVARLSSLSMDDMDDDGDAAMSARDALGVPQKKSMNCKSEGKNGEIFATTEQLGKRFISVLATDGRFHYEKFVQCSDIVCHYIEDPRKSDETIALLDKDWIAQYLETLAQCRKMLTLQASLDELITDMPEQYLDPLMNTVMIDPVRLPSGNLVDRSVIERHLLTAQVDPFTRCPLKPDMLEPCTQLRQEIQRYLQSKLQRFQHEQDDIAATWGIAWASLFDPQQPASAIDAEPTM